MARKPSDIVAPNLRIREELRRELKRKADKNRVSLNVEMMNRLKWSLDQEDAQSIAVSATSLETISLRLSKIVEGDLVVATEALLKQIDDGNHEAIKQAAENVRATLAVRKTHT